VSAPASDKKPLTPAKAFAVYKAMPKRSILQLETDLKASGYATNRKKLTTWQVEHRWEDKLRKTEGVAEILATAATVERITAEELKNVSSINEVLDVCAQVAVGLGKTSLATIAAVEILDVSDASQLARAMTDVAKAMAEIKKTLSSIGEGTPQGTVLAAAATSAPILEVLEGFKQARGLKQ
jgi:hypothetical protein